MRLVVAVVAATISLWRSKGLADPLAWAVLAVPVVGWVLA